MAKVLKLEGRRVFTLHPESKTGGTLIVSRAG